MKTLRVLKEVFWSSLPLAAIIILVCVIIAPMGNATVFIWVMGAGIGVFVGFALFRIIKNLDIKIVFAALYVIMFLATIFVPVEFIALAFDVSGATTGDVSVPFILALGLGVSATLSKRKTNDDTFGIIGIASAGPILALFIYGIVIKLMYGGVDSARGRIRSQRGGKLLGNRRIQPWRRRPGAFPRRACIYSISVLFD
jgi:hypothetical protein